ncbi:hypothetical protein ACO0LL_21390 [Undibacterium sp. TC4M20W]|uniref:hypothetical protein n=1 Tax=Undibacterium sp. TC4M20W TaxID=3413052 RepID=UPI003BF0B07E
MILLPKFETLNFIVQEIASTAPMDWRKIIYYEELLKEDGDDSLRNKSTVRCRCGPEMLKYDKFNVWGSFESMKAIEALYEDDLKSGKEWRGFLLVIHEDGRFNSQFFYDKTPLLDNNEEELEKILEAAESL